MSFVSALLPIPRRAWGVACAALLCLPAARAQDSTPAALALPLWEVGLFAGALSTPAYPASNQQTQIAVVLPFFVYRGDFWRVDRGGMGARMLHTDSYELDFGFAASLPASSNDIALRRGMPDLAGLIEFGPRIKMNLSRPPSVQVGDAGLSLELPLRAVLEVNSSMRQVGLALEPKLQYDWIASDRWRYSGAFSLVIADQPLAQYFYGVANAYATATRPAYQAQGGLVSSRLTVDSSLRLGPDITLFAYVRYALHNGAANQASPLFAQNHGTSAGIGLAWTLGRSIARAEEKP